MLETEVGSSHLLIGTLGTLKNWSTKTKKMAYCFAGVRMLVVDEVLGPCIHFFVIFVFSCKVIDCNRFELYAVEHYIRLANLVHS